MNLVDAFLARQSTSEKKSRARHILLGVLLIRYIGGKFSPYTPGATAERNSPLQAVLRLPFNHCEERWGHSCSGLVPPPVQSEQSLSLAPSLCPRPGVGRELPYTLLSPGADAMKSFLRQTFSFFQAG